MFSSEPRRARRASWLALAFVLGVLVDSAPQAAAQGGGVTVQDVRRWKPNGAGSGSIPPASPIPSPPQP